jgi:hypothetical protein
MNHVENICECGYGIWIPDPDGDYCYECGGKHPMGNINGKVPMNGECFVVGDAEFRGFLKAFEDIKKEISDLKEVVAGLAALDDIEVDFETPTSKKGLYAIRRLG